MNHMETSLENFQAVENRFWSSDYMHTCGCSWSNKKYICKSPSKHNTWIFTYTKHAQNAEKAARRATTLKSGQILSMQFPLRSL